MTIIESVRAWLRTYPPLAEGRLGVDYLPEEARTYSVDSVPAEETVKRYLDGSAKKRFLFVLASREFQGDNIQGNTENLAFYEAFSRWVEAQNRRPKHLPGIRSRCGSIILRRERHKHEGFGTHGRLYAFR